MFFSLAFLSFSLILFLMFNVWLRCCWFVLGVYGFILYSLFRWWLFISFVFNFLVGVGMGVVFEWFFVFLDF
ncbi:hypothetical protein ID0408_08770 [Helicobacter pylori]